MRHLLFTDPGCDCALEGTGAPGNRGIVIVWSSLVFCPLHQAAPKLLTALTEITKAASLVEANWEGSGLSEAVRFLLARRNEARAILAKLKA